MCWSSRQAASISFAAKMNGVAEQSDMQSVVSIAVVQQQLLASSHSSAVRIDDYISGRSEGLATSLTEEVRLSVVVDGTATIESNKAVAIGLVMTEIIINAIKHAFPRKRGGRIIVADRTAGSDWSLSVSDNGVGLSNPSMNDGRSWYATRARRLMRYGKLVRWEYLQRSLTCVTTACIASSLGQRRLAIS